MKNRALENQNPKMNLGTGEFLVSAETRIILADVEAVHAVDHMTETADEVVSVFASLHALVFLG